MQNTAHAPERNGTRLTWLLPAIGLLAMYLPTYLSLVRVFWSKRDGAYGAVIFVLVCWLFWRQRAAFAGAQAPRRRWPGFLLLVPGLMMYTVGASQSFHQLEVASQIPVLLGLGLLFLPLQNVRRLAFPLALLAFVIPVPGSIADEWLLPLKELVSCLVDNLLHFAGYPIARNGVVLLIGPYSLLIADACSGLNSMIALSGIGLLYLHLTQPGKSWKTAVLIAGIVPIALLANVLRVLSLVLITYYGGDDAGLSFHDGAAYLEIAFAFLAFFVLDHILGSGGSPLAAGSSPPGRP